MAASESIIDNENLKKSKESDKGIEENEMSADKSIQGSENLKIACQMSINHNDLQNMKENS